MRERRASALVARTRAQASGAAAGSQGPVPQGPSPPLWRTCAVPATDQSPRRRGLSHPHSQGQGRWAACAREPLVRRLALVVCVTVGSFPALSVLCRSRGVWEGLRPSLRRRQASVRRLRDSPSGTWRGACSMPRAFLFLGTVLGCSRNHLFALCFHVHLHRVQ